MACCPGCGPGIKFCPGESFMPVGIQESMAMPGTLDPFMQQFRTFGWPTARVHGDSWTLLEAQVSQEVREVVPPTPVRIV